MLIVPSAWILTSASAKAAVLLVAVNMIIIVAKAMADLATLLFNLILIYVSLFGEQSGVATAFNSPS